MARKADFVVVGSGIAGVRAAIELAQFGRVVVLTKSRADESNTEYAQGGIAVAMHDEDRIALHYQDTMDAGDGLCDPLAVQTLVEDGPARIEELIEWGTEFDKVGSKLSFTREAAHSRRRILHAGGDSTGQEINRTLIRKVRATPNVELMPHCFALDLVVRDGCCAGVRFLDDSGRVSSLESDRVLLSTGGIGTLYRETTNPDIATGDGFALAFRAGAALADMEFMQFHPTVLNIARTPRFLLSEALRGEGGILRNASGEAFMRHYHPQADLAPRDVVSRSIFLECRARQETRVFLDVTHLGSDFVKKRFPRIYSTCLELGLDLGSEMAPVFPAAHYLMGGVCTDLSGRTTLRGLFAAGEVACNGVHGANRLASNSLLDGLVFGARVGQAMASGLSVYTPTDTRTIEERPCPPDDGKASGSVPAVRERMTESVGIVRNAERLREALGYFESLPLSSREVQKDREANSRLLNARVTAAAALLREESRGGHFREDFPETSDSSWKVHLLARLEENKVVRFETAKYLNPPLDARSARSVQDSGSAG